LRGTRTLFFLNSTRRQGRRYSSAWTAFKAFFEGHARYPKFKKHRSSGSFAYPQAYNGSVKPDAVRKRLESFGIEIEEQDFQKLAKALIDALREEGEGASSALSCPSYRVRAS